MLDAAFFLDRVMPALNEGAVMSVKIIIPSAILGFLGGVLLGAMRVFGSPTLRRVGNMYTALFRGVPLVVQLMLVYYGLPRLGIMFGPYGAAVTCFVLCSAAYHSEYIRGALLSIRAGQFKAALALGFGRFQLLFSIIIPQALRRALPGCGNEIIYLIKYSSLAYIVTCIELTGQAKILASRSYRFTEVFIAAGLYYLACTTIATLLLRKLEKWAYIPGFGHKE